MVEEELAVIIYAHISDEEWLDIPSRVRFKIKAALSAWCQSRRGDVVVCEQSGSGWLPWTHSVEARDGGHKVYGEVYWFCDSNGGMFYNLEAQ